MAFRIANIYLHIDNVKAREFQWKYRRYPTAGHALITLHSSHVGRLAEIFGVTWSYYNPLKNPKSVFIKSKLLNVLEFLANYGSAVILMTTPGSTHYCYATAQPRYIMFLILILNCENQNKLIRMCSSLWKAEICKTLLLRNHWLTLNGQFYRQSLKWSDVKYCH